MASHVRTTIRYDGPVLSGHEMDVQDLAPALLALADIVQIANRRFNGSNADIRVLVNADVEQRCFQIDLSLIQSVLEKAKHLLADDHVKTALEIAKDIGLISGSSLSLFKLLQWLSKRPKNEGTKIEAKTEGGVTTLIAGDGNTVSVNQQVYLLATDPAVIERYKKVVEPLQRPGYDSLEFKQGDVIVDSVTREDARLVSELPATILDPSHEDISTINGHLRIKSPQYEGNAKWSVLWGGRAIDVAMPLEFVKAFQSNHVDAPPNTILTVEMEQKVALDEAGRAVGSPTFTVLSVRNVTPPVKPAEQLDWVSPKGRYPSDF
jgi:hypothetical protein